MINIVDNNEPLVDISSICEGLKINLEASRLKKEKGLYLRLSVANMLLKAQKMLPSGLTFCVNDAYRPLAVQQQYYKSYYNKFARIYPGYSKSKLHEITSKYVIDPNDPRRAGHLTGAAIDLVLSRNGRNLPMKNLSLNLENQFTTKTDQKNNYINNNRQLLYKVMTEVGFVNYKNEFWHYSYGDYMWAEATKNTIAFYGRV